jgi:hypothetical protein
MSVALLMASLSLSLGSTAMFSVHELENSDHQRKRFDKGHHSTKGPNNFSTSFHHFPEKEIECDGFGWRVEIGIAHYFFLTKDPRRTRVGAREAIEASEWFGPVPLPSRLTWRKTRRTLASAWVRDQTAGGFLRLGGRCAGILLSYLPPDGKI